jgi:hypothetical protein
MPVAMPSHASLLQSHRSSTSGLADYDGLSQSESAVIPDPLALFDEPPPPYPNNSLLVSPLSDVFPQSALLPTERHLHLGSFTPSPLAPVPLRHSSLYQVLKEDTAISPAQGTLQSGVSSIAHALEPQELQARQVPPVCLPVLGDAQGPVVSASDSPLGTGQPPSATSHAVVAVADPCQSLPQLVPTLAPVAQAQPPVSSATPPTSASARAQNGSVVTTPTQAHTLTLMEPIPPELTTTQDYDTLPRLRKVSPPPPLPPSITSCRFANTFLRKRRHRAQLQPPLLGSAKEGQSVVSSPLSPMSSRPSSSMGAPATSSRDDGKSALESAFTLPLVGRKRPVLRAKLACLFCRRRKIQCRPSPGDREDPTCQ